MAFFVTVKDGLVVRVHRRSRMAEEFGREEKTRLSGCVTMMVQGESVPKRGDELSEFRVLACYNSTSREWENK